MYAVLSLLGVLAIGASLIFIAIKTEKEKLRQGVGMALIIASSALMLAVISSLSLGEERGRGNPLPFSNLEQNKFYQVIGSVPEHKLLLIKNDDGKGIKYIVDSPREFQSGTTFLIKDEAIMVKN